MTLIVMTVVVITLMIAALVTYLFMIGTLLNRTADNLGDCQQNLRAVAGQAVAVGPGVKRLNKTSGELLDALGLLLDDVDGVTAKLAPSATPPEAALAAAGASPEAAQTAQASISAATLTRVGELDRDPAPPKGVGYLDL